MDSETLARLKLHLVPGLGPKTTRALLDHFENADRILQTSARELATIPNIGEKTAQQLSEHFAKIDVANEKELIDSHQVQLIHRDSTNYPALLRSIDGAPELLYFKGQLVEGDQRAVAIVGSRQCTNYGRRVATRLAGGLARAGVTVVSGLARGIDGIAHQSALESGGRSIAVLAGGLGKLYPPEHQELADRLIQQGALLSEMPMNVAPRPELFPRRNRIISGLSRVVIIVEAAVRSGALITASLAAEQGREVMAVPGPLDSELSEGPHQLIRKGATLVRTVDDVLEALGALPGLDRLEEASAERARQDSRSSAVPGEPPVHLTPVQSQVWQVLGTEGALMDDLVWQTSIPISELNSVLSMMELAGSVRRLPGNRFARK